MSLNCDQRSPAQVQAATAHAARVKQLYARALRNSLFYPEPERAELRQALNTEYSQFTRAVKLFAERTTIMRIRSELGTSVDVRSWVLYCGVPGTIAKFSFNQLSAADLTERNRIADQRLAAFNKIYDAAKHTAQQFVTDEQSRRQALKAIDDERRVMLRAFSMYRRGFSFKEIDRLTHAGIQSRALDGVVPWSTAYFGGHNLTREEVIARVNKAARLVNRVDLAIEGARRKNQALPKEQYASLLTKMAEARRDYCRAIALYVRGLEPSHIQKITGLPAQSWLYQDAMPALILSNSTERRSKQFRIPDLTPESALVVGAYLARRRNHQGKVLSISVPTAEAGEQLRANFKAAFGFDLGKAARLEHGLIYHIRRAEFIPAFIKFAEADCAEIKLPDKFMRYDFLRRPLLQGFLLSANGMLSIERGHYSVARKGGELLLKSAAVALARDGIHPRVTNEGEITRLIIDADSDIKRLLQLYPKAFASDKLVAASRLNGSHANPELHTSSGYQTVMNLLEQHFPPGTKLRYRLVEELLQGELPRIKLTSADRDTIWRWRNGSKPREALRAEITGRLEQELYPEPK